VKGGRSPGWLPPVRLCVDGRWLSVGLGKREGIHMPVGTRIGAHLFSSTSKKTKTKSCTLPFFDVYKPIRAPRPCFATSGHQRHPTPTAPKLCRHFPIRGLGYPNFTTNSTSTVQIEPSIFQLTNKTLLSVTENVF
jgi:hypothetical protein